MLTLRRNEKQFRGRKMNVLYLKVSRSTAPSGTLNKQFSVTRSECASRG